MKNCLILKFVKFFLALIFLSGSLLAQTGQPLPPKGYFLYPINPGQRSYLAGTQGEIRSNHFHGGIDIKTGGMEGLPVLAAADGYVQEVKVNSYGYGWVIYLKHPNGYVSVYAHLKKFNPLITEYVKSQQYNRESFAVDLFPKKGMLEVKKGDIIAWSGNTGSSSGPHLHFEIRDSSNYSVNPLLFGFDEIVDNTKPTITNVAFSCLDRNSRLFGKYDRREFYVSKIGTKSVIKDTILASGSIGLQFAGYDQLDGVGNKNGITYVSMICNDSVCYEQKLEKFPFAYDRCLNIHIDYKTFRQKGTKYQKCYIDDGNELGFYSKEINRGALNVEPGKKYKIILRANDINGNESEVEINIKGVPAILNKPNFVSFQTPKFDWNMDENVLSINASNYNEYTSGALIYCGTDVVELPVAYYDNGKAVYLWDMRIGIPDSAQFCDHKLRFNFVKEILPYQNQTYSNDDVEVFFGPDVLFDTLYLHYEKVKKDYLIGTSLTPIHHAFQVTIKDTTQKSDKVAAYEIKWAGNYSHLGGQWTEKGFTFSSKYFGRFTLRKDSIPPSISLVSKTTTYIAFKISDNLSGIKSFDAYLNGQWVLMQYEHKKATIWIDEEYWSAQKLKGDFKLVLKDNMNNVKEYNTKFL